MMDKKKVIIAAVGIVAIVGAGGYGIYHQMHPDETQVVTKETKVEQGNLTVGVTESGSVTLGTVEQKMDIDLQGSDQTTTTSGENVQTQETSEKGMGTGAGTSAGNIQVSQNQETQSTSTENSSSDNTLEIEEVYVSQGQTVEKGTPLLKVTKASASALQTQLEEEIKSKQLALKSAKLTRKETKIDAEYEYKKNKTTGENAKADYQATLDSLQSAVDEASDAVNEAKDRMKEIPKEIKTLQNKKKTLSQTASNKTSNSAGAAGAPSDTKTTTDTGSSSSSENNTNTVSGIEAQITALQSELSTVRKNYSSLLSRLSQAKSEQASGKITAKQTYEKALLNYENAKEIYDTAIQGLDEDVDEASEELKEAKKNLSAYTSYIKDGVISSEYVGTILSMDYQEGDTLTTDSVIATFADAVNMVVSVSQEDISQVEIDDTVDVVFQAYEDKTYSGIVTEMETSQTSSNSTTVDYDVTINVKGDVSKIFEGMTGNVTFITKQLKDVTYVSNKAVQTEGTKSYVKKIEGDKVTKVEVSTGFSNGASVEIKSGLKKGDTVLIESQVSGT